MEVVNRLLHENVCQFGLYSNGWNKVSGGESVSFRTVRNGSLAIWGGDGGVPCQSEKVLIHNSNSCFDLTLHHRFGTAGAVRSQADMITPFFLNLYLLPTAPIWNPTAMLSA